MGFRRFLLALILGQALLPCLLAGDIAGKIIIHRKLTKRNVTPTAGSYQRGVGVELAADEDSDPLAFERSRVIVYLEGAFPTKRTETVVIEQKGRRFLPDLIVVPAGSTITFPNRDVILHNVFSLSKAKTFDLGTYPKDQTRSLVLTKAGVVYVHCHLHPNMGAAIVVTPNQWSTRADASGAYSLKDVPDGTYTLVAWHKAAGFFRQKVEVSDGRVTTADFLLPAAEVQAATLTSRR